MDNLNPHYDDCYFSEAGGFAESLHVFVRGNGLDRRERMTGRQTLRVGETGFGTGLNLLALVSVLGRFSIPGSLVFFSCEKYPLKPLAVRGLLESQIGEQEGRLDSRLFEMYFTQYSRFFSKLKSGWNKTSWTLGGLSVDLNLFVGDVLEALEVWPQAVDAWFLDGHDPKKNPGMWSPAVFRGIGANSGPGTTLATYTACGPVKQGLRAAGFFIKRQKGFGGKRHMISGESQRNSLGFDII